MFQELMSVFEAVCADLIGPFKKLVKYLRAIVEHAVSTDRPNGKRLHNAPLLHALGLLWPNCENAGCAEPVVHLEF